MIKMSNVHLNSLECQILGTCLKMFGLLFFNKFIYFNWRLITLQYCIGFAIHQHESARCIHMFPILNPPAPNPKKIKK